MQGKSGTTVNRDLTSASAWLWAPGGRKPNAHILCRKDIEIATPVSSATISVAAESFAIVWVNNQEVLRTSSISYPGHHYYETIEVGKVLEPGINRLSVLAWYIGIPSGSSCPKDPGVRLELCLNSEGEELRYGTDESWSVGLLDAWQGQHRRSKWFNLDLVEICDFRRLPADWPTPTDLTGFTTPEVVHYEGRIHCLEQRPFPKCVTSDHSDLQLKAIGTVRDLSAEHSTPAEAMSHETITAKSLDIDSLASFTLPAQPADTALTMVFELGDYLAGYPCLTVTGCPGATIDIGYDECMPAGHLDIVKRGVFTADRYIAGDGKWHIQAEEWKAGSFLQITFRNLTKPLTVTDLRWKREDFPVNRTVELTSSDPVLERILEISLRAAELCMHDNIMDCPWREKRQWIGDAQRIGLINHYAFGENRLLRAVLRQQRLLQHPDGRMWVCLPLYEEYPMQSMAWVRAIQEFAQNTSDLDLLKELSGNITRLHQWFLSCRDERGLFFADAAPVCNWMDNSEKEVRKYESRTAFLSMNLAYLQFLKDVAFCLEHSGLDSRTALDERHKLAKQIVPNFLDSSTKLLRECADEELPVYYSEFGHALAALTDIPGIDSVDLWDRFRKASGENIICSTPFAKHWTLELLGRLGRKEELVHEIVTCWKPMVDAGAFTTWERFDNPVTGGSSHCHGWAGVPVVAVMRHILGIDPKDIRDMRVEGAGDVEWIECKRI